MVLCLLIYGSFWPMEGTRKSQGDRRKKFLIISLLVSTVLGSSTEDTVLSGSPLLWLPMSPGQVCGGNTDSVVVSSWGAPHPVLAFHFLH